MATVVVVPGMSDHVISRLQTGCGLHIFRLLGAFEIGFILIFIPLLTLSANLLAKSKSADTKDRIFGDHQDKYEHLLQLIHSTT